MPVKWNERTANKLRIKKERWRNSNLGIGLNWIIAADFNAAQLTDGIE